VVLHYVVPKSYTQSMHATNYNDMHSGAVVTCEMGARSCGKSMIPTGSKHATLHAIVSEQEQANKNKNMFYVIYYCVLSVFTPCTLVFNMPGRHVLTCKI